MDFSIIPDQTEYCLLDTFNPRCPSGEVIMITSSKFGRMTVGKCVPVDFGRYIYINASYV